MASMRRARVGCRICLSRRSCAIRATISSTASVSRRRSLARAASSASGMSATDLVGSWPGPRRGPEARIVGALGPVNGPVALSGRSELILNDALDNLLDACAGVLQPVGASDAAYQYALHDRALTGDHVRGHAPENGAVYCLVELQGLRGEGGKQVGW